MRTLQGIAISPGFTEGVAVVYDYETDHRLEFPDRDISPSEIGAEHGRLEGAMEESHRELKQAAHTTSGALDKSADVLAAHASLVHDIAAKVKQIGIHNFYPDWCDRR